LNDQSIKEFGVKIINNPVMFLNKSCQKYLIENRDKNITGEILVWNDIPLRVDLNKNGVREITEATDIVIDIKIAKEIFEIPNNIEVIDMTSLQNN